MPALIAACARVAAGDLENRIPVLGEPGSKAEQVRDAVNALIDVIDAYVRESHATLEAASTGAFERGFLVAGMPGSFREGARRINLSREAIMQAAQNAEKQKVVERELAEQSFEASQLLAAAAVELGASADSLNSFAADAVGKVRQAVATVGALEESSSEIEHALVVITRVAAQTRLLALNATIEASRAGDAGRGFAVVASEVKALADEVAQAADGIASQVRTSQADSARAIGAIEGISSSVEEMGQLVDQIAVATNGSEGHLGLAQMAERLHTDTGRLLHRDHAS
jgi:methyl-accepting chemotaxis protein